MGVPGSGKPLEEGNGNPLQYSCMENPMDRGAWQATVHGVTKNWTWMKWQHACMFLEKGLPNSLSWEPWLTVLIYSWIASFWRRQWHPTPVLLPGKSHGQRGLVGCSPWGCEESDRTKQLHFHFSRSCIGEGIGNPLWCSCLENPRDGGAWWAAFYGVIQSQTRLKRLSSSSWK